jgi:hypothetical protein
VLTQVFTWSPDGAALASWRKQRLWVSAADGTQATAITGRTRLAFGLAWRPLRGP